MKINILKTDILSLIADNKVNVLNFRDISDPRCFERRYHFDIVLKIGESLYLVKDLKIKTCEEKSYDELIKNHDIIFNNDNNDIYVIGIEVLACDKKIIEYTEKVDMEMYIGDTLNDC